eukprot:5029559-Pleurochrysis_carterae.AAC.1
MEWRAADRPGVLGSAASRPAAARLSLGASCARESTNMSSFLSTRKKVDAHPPQPNSPTLEMIDA